MTDKINIGDHINKQDLEMILQVNRKAIEIETAVVEQNESIIKLLEESEKKTKSIEDKIEKLDRDLFKIQVLFLSGAISLIIQIIQIIKK